jgi:hypothetical protein
MESEAQTVPQQYHQTGQLARFWMSKMHKMCQMATDFDKQFYWGVVGISVSVCGEEVIYSIY